MSKNKKEEREMKEFNKTQKALKRIESLQNFDWYRMLEDLTREEFIDNLQKHLVDIKFSILEATKCQRPVKKMTKLNECKNCIYHDGYLPGTNIHPSVKYSVRGSICCLKTNDVPIQDRLLMVAINDNDYQLIIPECPKNKRRKGK
jgi:hypothetical protein